MKSVVAGALTGFAVTIGVLSVLSVLVPPSPPVAQTSAPAAAALPAMQPQASVPKAAEGAPEGAPLSRVQPAPAPAEGAPKVPLAGPAPGAGAAPSAPSGSPQVSAGPQAPATGSAAPVGAQTAVAPIAAAPADRVPAPAKIEAAPGVSPVDQPPAASPAPAAGSAPETPQAMGEAPSGGAGAPPATAAPPRPGFSDAAPAGDSAPKAPQAVEVAPPAPLAASEGATGGAPAAGPAPSHALSQAPSQAPSQAAPTLPQAATPDGAAQPVEGAQGRPRVLALPAPTARAPATGSLPQVGGPAKTGTLPGVPSGRLPQVTGPAAGQDAAGLSMPGTHVSGLPGQAVAPLVGTAPGAVQANAPIKLSHTQPASNPDQKPEMAIILIDDGRKTLDRSILSQTKLPVTYAVDPVETEAGKWAADYADGGHEVLLALRPLPERTSPSALDAALQDYFRAVPQALGLMDAPAKGFQANRGLSQELVGLLAVAGRGLVTYDHGLNAAAQVARGAGLPETMVSSALMNGDTEALRILLDRAAFRAAQQGRIVVAAPARTSVLAAIADWAQSLRGKTVALVPVSALMEK